MWFLVPTSAGLTLTSGNTALIYPIVAGLILYGYGIPISSCNLRISFTVGPLLKRVCVNTTTLLNQNGGNLLIERKVINISLCF